MPSPLKALPGFISHEHQHFLPGMWCLSMESHGPGRKRGFPMTAKHSQMLNGTMCVSNRKISMVFPWYLVVVVLLTLAVLKSD